MCAVAYVNKFLRARGGGGNNFKNLDSLLGLKPVLVPRKFLGRFTPLEGKGSANEPSHFSDRSESDASVNTISTIGKQLVNPRGLPYMPPNLVNFGPLTAENGWRVFAHPLNFRIGRHCQPYRKDVL